MPGLNPSFLVPGTVLLDITVIKSNELTYALGYWLVCQYELFESFKAFSTRYLSHVDARKCGQCLLHWIVPHLIC